MNLLNNFTRRSVAALTLTVFLMLSGAAATFAQTSAFTYQGRFTDTTVQQPTNGTYTMTFRLYDAATGGNQVVTTPTEIMAMVSVVNGLFTTRLDFGAAAFNTTDARYLEIQVGNTILTTRQEITSTPFSQRALNAANADSLGGVAANQYVQTNDARLSDSRTPTAGSTNYIQNTTTQQPLTNFNISGNGVVGGKVGIGTTAAPTTASLQVSGGVLARGGAPGANGASNNGYAFSSSGGDTDGGMFSTADGTVQLYANNAERIRLTRSINLTAGNGDTAFFGSPGAGIALQAGNGGDGVVGGEGAGIALQAGNGGTASGNGPAASAGNGAGITLQAGNGGGADAGSGGTGASITLQPGIGGNSNTGSDGVSGNVILSPTNGNVGIGTTSPTSKLSVNGDLTVTGTINGVATSQFVQSNNTTAFIRNQTTQQTGNFNISGSGTIGGNLNVTGNVVTNGNLFAVGGGENLRIVRGIFQVSGGVVTITGGSGFTVTRNSTGNYTVNFTTPFSSVPVVIPSVISGATIIGTGFLNNSVTTITAYSPSGNPGDPSYVMFIAVGPK